MESRLTERERERMERQTYQANKLDWQSPKTGVTGQEKWVNSFCFCLKKLNFKKKKN